MEIYSLRDYKFNYNKREEADGNVKYIWDYQKFIDDMPTTESLEINNQLSSLLVDLKFGLEKNSHAHVIRKIEGKVYITLKQYFESPEAKAHYANMVRVDRHK